MFIILSLLIQFLSHNPSFSSNISECNFLNLKLQISWQIKQGINYV